MAKLVKETKGLFPKKNSFWENTNLCLRETVKILERGIMENWYPLSRRTVFNLEANSKELGIKINSLKNISKKEFAPFARVDPSFKSYLSDWNSSLSKLEKDQRDLDKDAKKLAGLFGRKVVSILQTSLDYDGEFKKRLAKRNTVYDLAAVKAIDKIGELRKHLYAVEEVVNLLAQDRLILVDLFLPKETDRKFVGEFKARIDRLGKIIESLSKTVSNLLDIMDDIEGGYVSRMSSS